MRQADGMSATPDRHFKVHRHSAALQGIARSANNNAEETLKYKQHSSAENPGGMLNKPSSFIK